MTFTWDLRVADPVPSILHQYQMVICAYPTAGLPFRSEHIVEEIIPDPQGDMVAVRDVKTGNRGTYWLWRFWPPERMLNGRP